jgi:hypothetical protein
MAALSNVYFEPHVSLVSNKDVCFQPAFGTLDFVLAMLSLLDNKPLFKTTPTSGTGKIRTKPGSIKPWHYIYESVDVTMSPTRMLSAMRRAVSTRRPKMAHEVREHWAYRRKSINLTCSHEWQATGVNTQERCKHCSGLRWHRNSFRRGNSAYGTKVRTHTRIR